MPPSGISPTSLSRLFELQIQARPDAVAAICGDRSLTYRELGLWVEARVRRLRRLGIRREKIVAVWGRRDLDLLISLLAILEAGGVYLPLDPRNPPVRQREVLALGEVALVLVHGDSRAGAEPVLATLPAIPWQWLEDLAESDHPPPWHRRPPRRHPQEPKPKEPEQLAYVIFTSGSTGRPKGAMVMHKGLNNHLRAKIASLQLGASDVVAQTASQAFDISIWQFLAPLCVGGRVEILAETVMQDPVSLIEAVTARQVTVLETVPSLLRLLLDRLEVQGGPPESWALRWLMATGEALPPDLCRRWLTLCPHIPLVNAYGPTECSDDVTQFVVDVAGDGELEAVPIGTALPALELRVLDPALRPVASMEVGQLWVGGVGVGRGYLRDPARTAEVFRPNPDPRAPGERLYATGDLGFRGPDGNLYFKGRIDHQIKLRGYRIELVEIETALSKHPEVGSAAVVAVENAVGHPQIVACVVLGRKRRPRAGGGERRLWETLGRFLARQLPRYMVPQRWFTVEALPLTPNGKVDRHRLEELSWQPALEGPPSPPAVSDRGGAPRSGVPGLGLPSPSSGTRVRQRIEDIYPLAPMQQGMLFHSLYAGDSAVYTQQLICRLQGELNVDAFRRAWQRVVDRHGVLRTSFDWEELEQPVQIVHRGIEAPWELLDWQGLEPSEQARRVEERLSSERRQGFELHRPPLLRLILIRLRRDRHQLIWTYHHALLDGWSQVRVLEEMETCYRQELAPELDGASHSGSLPPLRPYRDYIAWLRRAEDTTAAESYWRRLLSGFEPTAPVSSWALAGTPPAEEDGVHHRTVHLAAADNDRLQRFARQQGVTPSILIYGAWGLLLSRYGARADVLFGVTVAGRSAPLDGLETMVGVFINSLPLRLRFDPERSLTEVLQALQEQLTASGRYESIPLTQIQKWSSLDGGQPLFESLVVVENFPMSKVALEAPSLRMEGFRLVERTNYPLTLEVGLGETLELQLGYDLESCEAAAAHRCLRHLQTLLRAFPDHGRKAVRELPLLSAAERQHLLWEVARGEVAPIPDLGLHAWIAQQALRTPEATALVTPGERWTYGQVEARSDALARRLAGHGVGVGSVVGLLLERSPALAVAAYAVLKAGAAFLPLDPSLPARRLAGMIADGAAAIVVCTSPEAVEELSEHALPLPLEPWEEPAGDAGWNLRCEAPPPISGEAAAYVIFTSGSTGRPKGVVVSHRAIVNRLAWMQRTFELQPAEAVLHKAAIGFDVAVWEIFWALLVGARTVFAPASTEADPDSLFSIIREYRVAVAHFVPSMLDSCLLRGGFSGCPTLRAVICSGEILSTKLVREFFAHSLPGVPGDGGCRLHNLYGPTEAAIDVSGWRCAPETAGASAPIGLPMDNLEIHLLDADLEPVPIGVAAELFIGGVGLARGYSRRPAETAARFRPHPFPNAPGERLYATGDLARRRPGGEVEILGRRDHQVKIRGQRIELEEIELALGRLPGIRQGLVALEHQGPQGPRLVAYLQPDAGFGGERRRAVPPVSAAEVAERWNLETLVEELAQSLPRTMMPAEFHFLDQLPRTSSGKLDRRSLSTLPKVSAVSTERFVAPETEIQKRVAAAWQKVLGPGVVGLHDGFFARGGDSLSLIRLSVALGEVLGRRVAPVELYDRPTVFLQAQLAEPKAESDAESVLNDASNRARRRLQRAAGGRAGRRWGPRGPGVVDS